MQPFPGKTPLFFAQIETLDSVNAVEAIAAVDGVDVLFVGPADLQFDLQARGQASVDYETCLQQVVAAAAKTGKQCGILCRDAADLEKLLGYGFGWIAVDSDLGLLRAGYQRWIRQARDISTGQAPRT